MFKKKLITINLTSRGGQTLHSALITCDAIITNNANNLLNDTDKPSLFYN